MSIRYEELSKRLMDLVIDGAGLYAGKKIIDFTKPYTKKTLKQYNDGAIKIAISMADLVLPQIRQFPYVGDWLALWGRDGVNDVIKLFVDKPADCWAEDANTIKCINFDVTVVSVKIDGTTVTPTISGTAEELTLHLSSPLSSGAHDLLVAGNKVAWSGKIYV
jgi:hypothetical protein